VTPVRYTASIQPGKPHEIPAGFAQCILRLEEALSMPVWFLIQPGGPENFQDIDYYTRAKFCSPKSGLPKGQKIALVIDCPGGHPKSAYQIARHVRSHCGGFFAVVPEFAKSAATLLLLGADKIILGKNAELGPLDAQLDDRDREQRLSALDEVQALERLNVLALQAFDSTMLALKRRTRKSYNALMPIVQHFVAETLRPLFDKIDTVHYTQMARLLKVTEEYAVRLLQPKYVESKAKEIARQFVHEFPEHEFFIGIEDARACGLDSVEEPHDAVASILDDMIEYLQVPSTFIGKLEVLAP
jgi:hypothetical protein